MQLKEILLGVPVLLFIFWVFAAPIPQDRIVRACEPIHWVGNLATSTTALSAENHTATTVRWSDKLNYSCQYMTWRLFYQEDYNKAVAAGLVKPATDAAEPDGKDTPKADKTNNAPAKKADADGEKK